MFHKILAALDASGRAPGVLDMAARIAQFSGARLHVLRAILIPPEFPPAAGGSPTDPLVAQMTMNAAQDLSRLMASVPTDVSLEPPIVCLGTPWRSILATAEEYDVDLIVIGSHGYHGWDRVLGTTAAKVANSSTRNVLVVHQQRLSLHGRQTSSPGPQ